MPIREVPEIDIRDPETTVPTVIRVSDTIIINVNTRVIGSFSISDGANTIMIDDGAASHLAQAIFEVISIRSVQPENGS